MAKVILSCPGCSGQVELGTIKCPHCGMNLKSGESYEEQIKKAKGKAEHHEGLAAPLLIGFVLVFALFLFAGWKYQSRMEQGIADRSDLFVPIVQEFQNIDDLVAEGKADIARQRAQKLIEQIQKDADSIDVPDPYAREKESPYRPVRSTKKYDEAGVHSLLLTLKAKAERKLAEMPAS